MNTNNAGRQSDAEETLKKRAEAHMAACAGLEEDPLIKAAFGKPAPIEPLRTPMMPGGMLRRQAD